MWNHEGSFCTVKRNYSLTIYFSHLVFIILHLLYLPRFFLQEERFGLWRPSCVIDLCGCRPWNVTSMRNPLQALAGKIISFLSKNCKLSRKRTTKFWQILCCLYTYCFLVFYFKFFQSGNPSFIRQFSPPVLPSHSRIEELFLNYRLFKLFETLLKHYIYNLEII